MASFEKRSRIEAPAQQVFAWHSRSGAFERLTPPWENVEIEERYGGIENGARLVLRMGRAPFQVRWVAEHRNYIEGEQFCDVQTRGPFSCWEHTHRVEAEGELACVLQDRIEYTLPLGRLGAILGGPFTRGKLERMFRYRHTVTAQDAIAHRRAGARRPMNVLITGSKGLVGRALVPFLTTGGHNVTRAVRSGSADGAVLWDPARGRLEATNLRDLDAVVHLAGENISEGRWTEAKKKRILDSRVQGTRLIAETLAKLDKKPAVLVCASAIGFYGDRGDVILDESAEPGSGFLADVCSRWEKAAQPARDAGIRVVHLRLGVVISGRGGALAKMLLPFRFGLGGALGDGGQYVSWIALDDAVGVIHFALFNESLDGAVNAVAPNPVTNRAYTKALGKVLSRPTLFPVPTSAVKVLFGEMGRELLLTSTRVHPRKLLDAGFSFRFPQIEGALRHELGR